MKLLPLRVFFLTKYVGQSDFRWKEETIIALDSLIKKSGERGVEQFVMGMAHRGRLNVLANIFENQPDIFGNLTVKITIRSTLMGM
jgi:2-oxoglutarate dehydrogenase E1 component